MARTPGSGWGGGTILYQKCPLCGKKKAMYHMLTDCGFHPFKCTACKEFFDADNLIRKTFVSQLNNNKD